MRVTRYFSKVKCVLRESVVLLTAIIGSQFARLRRADRFFYEDSTHRSTRCCEQSCHHERSRCIAGWLCCIDRFRPGELAEIKKVTMARILCNNMGKGESDGDILVLKIGMS